MLTMKLHDMYNNFPTRRGWRLADVRNVVLHAVIVCVALVCVAFVLYRSRMTFTDDKDFSDISGGPETIGAVVDSHLPLWERSLLNHPTVEPLDAPPRAVLPARPRDAVARLVKSHRARKIAEELLPELLEPDDGVVAEFRRGMASCGLREHLDGKRAMFVVYMADREKDQARDDYLGFAVDEGVRRGGCDLALKKLWPSLRATLHQPMLGEYSALAVIAFMGEALGLPEWTGQVSWKRPKHAVRCRDMSDLDFGRAEAEDAIFFFNEKCFRINIWRDLENRHTGSRALVDAFFYAYWGVTLPTFDKVSLSYVPCCTSFLLPRESLARLVKVILLFYFEMMRVHELRENHCPFRAMRPKRCYVFPIERIAPAFLLMQHKVYYPSNSTCQSPESFGPVAGEGVLSADAIDETFDRFVATVFPDGVPDAGARLRRELEQATIEAQQAAEEAEQLAIAAEAAAVAAAAEAEEKQRMAAEAVEAERKR